MSRTVFVDAFAGLAGDMLVAALVDAGAPLDRVVAGLRGLGVEGWAARVERVMRGPFAATRFVVELDGPVQFIAGGAHDHSHAHGHGSSHDHAHDHTPAGPSRAWRDIRALITSATLPDRARQRALATFERLAAAEGRVHGIAPDDVGFHEVGAVDSIVDIVGVCLALEELDVDRLVVGPLPLGAGHTRGDHGWIPLPAPATIEVLRGFPVYAFPHPGESITPTGAALMAALAEPGPMPAMRVEAIGYGAGTRDPSTHPNVVRVLVGAGEAGAQAEVVELLAQVDGVTGEGMPGLIQALLDAGAVDAWVTPILMKKGRPAYAVAAIAPVAARVVVGDTLLRLGATLGYRWSVQRREVLARRHDRVETRFGTIRVKVGERAGLTLHAAPEFEDCRAAADRHGVALAQVQAAALAAWRAPGND